MISAINQTSTQLTGFDATTMKNHREEMFSKMDTNGDGKIDKAEFTAFQQQSGKTGGPMSPDELFAKMDTDGDGSISKAEFEAFKPPHHHKTSGQAGLSDLFSKMDANGDGSVSKAEFEAFLQQMEDQAGTSQANSAASATLQTGSTVEPSVYQSNGQAVQAAQSALEVVG